MSRDDIVTAPTGGKKPATQQDLEPDIEFLPKFGAFLALTDLGNEWTDHCKDTMNPPSLAELTAAAPFYPMYHAIRVINLAKRCELVTFLTGTQEDLAGWVFSSPSASPDGFLKEPRKPDLQPFDPDERFTAPVRLHMQHNTTVPDEKGLHRPDTITTVPPGADIPHNSIWQDNRPT